MGKSNHMFRSYPDVLNVKDLQKALDIGKAAAYSLLETGEIRSFRIGRAYKIPKTALINYINDKSC